MIFIPLFIYGEICCIRNLNKINAYKDDLYIHVRSSDIFFNNKFNKVYLIAQDKNNPIIEKMLKEFSNVIFIQNRLKEDISYLINAYNIVASISSFLNSIIQLNYNLKNLFDYNIYKISEKILSYHYDLFQFPRNNFITIFAQLLKFGSELAGCYQFFMLLLK